MREPLRHRWALSSVLVALAFLVLGGCMPYSTGPTEVGVRTIKFGLFRKAGVDPKIYAPGSTYWLIPVINDWNTFDTKIQVLEMVLEAGRGDREGRDDLLFKTIDGNDISLDVIISYRIIPEKAPDILQFVAQSDEEIREYLVRTVTRSTPRDIFGELTTEEFYVSDKRAAKATRAKEMLNEILTPHGIVVENVLTKDYRFKPAYQKAIEERKVADQLAEKAKSETRAAEEEWRRRLEEAIGTVNEMVARADGAYLQAKIEADAYYEQQAKVAKAVQAEAEAEAQGMREMIRALEGEGGEALVKLKIAEALQDKRILLLPISGGSLDVKTTDINRLLEIYGLQQLPASGRKKEPDTTSAKPPDEPSATQEREVSPDPTKEDLPGQPK